MKKADPNRCTRRLCQLLSISPSSFYLCQQKPKVSLARQELIDTVTDIHEDMGKTYGKRRMRVELQSKGFDIGVYQTATLMKQANIRAIRPRKRHVYKTNECEKLKVDTHF